MYLDNKIVSLGEGKSKSDSKNNAAIYALKYLLSLDESCFENALFILNRSKKGSNSKQRNSATKDSQLSANKELTSPRKDFGLEEVKIDMENFIKKRKASNPDKLYGEGENPIRKKLQYKILII